MKKIELFSGEDCLVDDEDFEEISKKKWYILKNRNRNTCYAQTHVKLNGKDVKDYMHRIIMKLSKNDERYIDHIDGNGLNNQKNNLRFCTISQNAGNSSK